MTVPAAPSVWERKKSPYRLPPHRSRDAGHKTERGIALEEGVHIEYLQALVEYFGDENGRLQEMMVIEMERELDKSGRCRPVPKEGPNLCRKQTPSFWP
ncbi:MAG: hypothetical protein H6661_07145 [Ardenticatenaceae bacterium]|nr:hypothetical protein [Ardenticatenaceae bacterium]